MMKRKLTQLVITSLAGLTLHSAPLQGAQNREKTLYLGVVNGQVQGNSVVKVTRTLPEPLLYQADSSDTLPEQLFIRNAQARLAPGGMAWITVRQPLPDNQETRITLKTALRVDGSKLPVLVAQRGNDVVIPVPAATTLVELLTEAPAELEVPANYRGNIQIALQVEGEGAEN